jgi:hypothetical protein
MQIPEKIRAKARTDPSHKYQLVAPVEAHYKRAKKLPRAFRFGISTYYKLLLMEQLDLDPGAATRSSLVNGFRPLTDQSPQTRFANLFKEVLRVVSQSC